jgi:hypothetical protein
MVKSHNLSASSHQASSIGARKPLPPVAPPLEDAIYAAVDAEKERGPTSLSFAPVYAFTAGVAHIARARETGHHGCPAEASVRQEQGMERGF